MRPARVAVAVIVALLGAVWFSQGIGILPGEVMNGSLFWAIVGLALRGHRRRARGDGVAARPPRLRDRGAARVGTRSARPHAHVMPLATLPFRRETIQSPTDSFIPCTSPSTEQTIPWANQTSRRGTVASPAD